MDRWQDPDKHHESHSHGYSHGLSYSAGGGAFDMASSMPVGMNFPVDDNDALLDALVFLDDLELDSDDVPPHVFTHNATAAAQAPCALPLDPVHHELFPMEMFPPQMMVTAMTPPMPSDDAATQQQRLRPPREASRQFIAVVVPPSPAPSSPVSSTSATSSTTGAATAAPVKGVVNRSRNRRREELTYLRGLVTELEGRLTTLHSRADDQQQLQQQQTTLVTTSDPNEPKEDPVLTAVWEDLASRQYTQRQRAEVENAKLRRMLEEQIQVGKSLERLLKKRTNTEDMGLHLHGKRPRRSSLSIEWNNGAIFDELLASIPSQYLDTDKILTTHNYDRGTPCFRDIQVKNDPEMGVLLEVVEAHVFPFAYELTSNELFKIFLDIPEQDRFHYHDVTIQDDTLKAQSGITVQLARAQGEFNMKLVSRRYVEDKRTIVVWAGFCDPTKVSDTNMDGIYMRHRGWTIIEPLHAADTGSRNTDESSTTLSPRPVATRTRSYSVAVPEAFDDVPDQKRKVGTLTNFMLSTIDIHISSRLQMVENRLVESSLQAAKAATASAAAPR